MIFISIILQHIEKKKGIAVKIWEMLVKCMIDLLLLGFVTHKIS